MRAKEYLGQIRLFEFKIKKLEESIELIETRLTSLSVTRYDAPVVQSSPQDRMAEEMSKLDGLEKKTGQNT